MKQITIVDTQSPELLLLVDHISADPEISVDVVSSLDEINDQSPSLLILAQKLSPDNYTPLNGVPTILITGELPLQSKPFFMAKKLLDTVIDYSSHNCRYIVSLLKRLSFLSEMKVLLCEGENLMASMIKRNLTTVGVESIVVSSADEATAQLADNSEIRMVLVSSSFNRGRGVEVVSTIRDTFSKDELPIVGLLDEVDSDEIEVGFLRSGATDTIRKRLSSPASMEIFRSRIMLSLQQVISFLEVSQMAQRDFMTGAFNRRYFFESGKALFANAQRGNMSLYVAMFDIDNFKSVNDMYGHASGDKAIVGLSRELEKSIRQTDLMARFGGEEFCVIICGATPESGFSVMDRIRKSVEKMVFHDETGDAFSFTVSVGFTVVQQNCLEDMVIESDRLLYEAKESGKNRVVTDFIQK